MQKRSKGFTLVEMLVVVAIIAILVSILVPAVHIASMRAKGAADAANIRSLAAQAGIESMELPISGALTKEFYSQVFNKSGTVDFFADSGAMVARISIGTDIYSLEQFVKAAETGIKP